MREAFIDKEFSKGFLAIIELAQQICASYKSQGYDLSVRQLYYQFIRRDYFANTEANYKKLGSIISDARLAGMIDWA